MTAAFVFALYSRIFEFFGTSIRAALVLSSLALLGALFSGRFLQKLKSPTTTLLTWLTVWMLISTVFSVWPSGSFDEMWNRWLRNLMVYVLIVVNIRTIPQLRLLSGALAAALATVAVLGMTIGTLTRDARLALPQGLYSNPNEFALAIASGLVLFGLIAVDRERSWLTRLFSILAVPVCMFLVLRSGSRGVLLAVVAALLYRAWKSSLGDKIKILIAVPLLAVVALSYSGGAVLDRFQDALGQDGEADGSTSERMQLLQDSLGLTLRNPLLGVGPGMFMVAQNSLAKDRGWRRGNWNGTHNTYAQFACETGIPGLLLFLAITYHNLERLRWISGLNLGLRRRARSQIGTMCQTVQTLWILYCVSFVFFHYVFSFFLPALVGISVATISCLGRELAEEEVSVPQSVRAAAPTAGVGKGVEAGRVSA